MRIGVLVWLPALALGCRDDRTEHCAELEAQVAALTARIDALEQRAMSGEPPLVELGQGRVVELLDAKRALRCAVQELQGIITVQRGFEAAFDRYPESFEEVGWAPSQVGGCAANVAFRMAPYPPRITFSDAMPAMPEAIAVIIRGEARGRVLAVDSEARVYELAALPDADVTRIVAGQGWVGATSP